MIQAILINTDKWNLTSYGNGLAYCLTDKTNISGDEDSCSLFVQGDDAITFRDELESLETTYPERPFNDLLGMIWSWYK